MVFTMPWNYPIPGFFALLPHILFWKIIKFISLVSTKLAYNPAGQSVTVGWSATGFEGLLEIWTIGGACVQHVKIAAAETFKVLDISTLAKGVYFVRLNTERRSVAKKLVVE
jgi:hypothetical protein